jgi:hypothetical protein
MAKGALERGMAAGTIFWPQRDSSGEFFFSGQGAVIICGLWLLMLVSVFSKANQATVVL